MAKIKRLEVDRRVGIALSVLPPNQKQLVEKIIGSVRAFTQATLMPGRVKQMAITGGPLYCMRVSSSLRLYYTTIGETAYVVDIVERATLRYFAKQKAAKKLAKSPTSKKSPKTTVKKAPIEPVP